LLLLYSQVIVLVRILSKEYKQLLKSKQQLIERRLQQNMIKFT
jgi:hypothetical protein